MNNPQSSLPPEPAGAGRAAETGEPGMSGPKKVGVYERPEPKSGLSPLLLGVIAVLIIAVIMAILAFRFVF